MKPRQSDEQEPQGDLFKVELQRLVDPADALVKLAPQIEWGRLEETFGALYHPSLGAPGVPTRLMIGLHYLKYAHDLSDEETLEGWRQNPYWQFFCGGKWFEHRLPIDASSMTRWRARVEEHNLESLLAELLQSGLRLKVITPGELEKVNVDTTVQPKAIRYPTDARLYERMRTRLVMQARREGIVVSRPWNRKSRQAFHRQSAYARARQFKRARRECGKLKLYLGRVHRQIARASQVPSPRLEELLGLSAKLLKQKRHDKEKLYSVHEPHVECLSKGKAHKRYEFGCKASFVSSARGNWVLGAQALHGLPYDGHTLQGALGQAERISGQIVRQAAVDLGYRGHKIKETTVLVVQRQRRGIASGIKRWWKRRSAIEPVIGHLKSEHRLERNRLKGRRGDTINALLSACGFNLRKLLRAVAHFWSHFLLLILPLFVDRKSRISLAA